LAAPEFSCEGIVETLRAIEAASNGRIELTIYASWSGTSVMTCVDDMNAGVVDIVCVPINEHLNLFPYSNLVTYTPFLGIPNITYAATLYDEMYDEYPQFAEEYAKNGIVYWTNYPCAPYNIFTTQDYQIKTPADLNGKKLITSSSAIQQFIQSHGGAPISTPVTEYATSLNTGVADGIINHVNVVNAFGCMDFIKGVTQFGEQGLALNLMMVCFSQSAWDGLPADLQQLFTDNAETLRDAQTEDELGMNINNLANLEAAGCVITELTAEEIAVWADAFQPNTDAYIQELIDGGATDAQTLYDAVKAKIAAYAG
ncbi:MAG: TRAP transporter substrate-binding protein DctP, partial [Clostridia bacterium]|nr:TRAP transporter substrate-binding protein DctP [Clostridia bacterium]